MEYRAISAAPVTAAALPRRNVGLFARLLVTNRFVLGFALLFGVVLPAMLAAGRALGGWVLHPAWVYPTWGFMAGSIVAGHLSLQRMGTMPLISARSLILPNFLAAYAAGLAVAFVFQLHVSKVMGVISFALVVAWYVTVSMLRGRYLRPVIGLLGAETADLTNLPSKFGWRLLGGGPDLRNIDGKGLAAVVVDPHATLDIDSTHLITQFVLAGIPVYHRSHFEESLTGRVRFNSHADNNFGALLPSLTWLRMKRGVDLLGALILLPIVAPLILGAALLVRLDSPGPVIFRQTRMGYRGACFDCYKLRTMRVDQGGPAFTLPGDARVTRIGKFLRKWRIDELPQIVNILKGDMSWIGPRPEALGLATRYAAHIPFYDYRHAVRPGISGWAAVHQGNVGDVDAAREKLGYDFYYIKYFSIWLDFLIVLKTAQTVLSGFGSR